MQHYMLKNPAITPRIYKYAACDMKIPVTEVDLSINKDCIWHICSELVSQARKH
jgi:hypothetical protein